MDADLQDATAQHVSRTLRALELLAGGSQTQADIARSLAVHRRTARRLLARLVAEGYAEGSPRGRHVAYVASPRLAVLGRQVADGLDPVAISRRHLTQIDDISLRSRFIALLGPAGTWLAHVEAPGDDDLSTWTGSPTFSAPLHATAAGKVYLSADTELLSDVLNHELLAFTATTHVRRADLLLELAEIRGRGYATEDGEYRAGTCAVAAGVTDHAGKVVAVLGATPQGAVDIHRLGPLVRDAALGCSREIGGAID